jgi:acyl-CoA reductase-like NAD-dependent aldehyde dehydrogenase
VEVLFDGEGKIYFDDGFDKFARAHNLEVGCLLVNRYEDGDDMSVTGYDDSGYRRHYHIDNSDDGNDE